MKKTERIPFKILGWALPIVLLLIVCSQKSSDQRTCNTESDCLQGEVCFRGICVPACLSNADCSSEEVCFEGICLLACQSNADCSAGEICLAGLCQPEGDGGHGDVAISKVNMPQFSPLEGSFDADIEVTLTSSTAGAIIYYTTDGSSPMAGSYQIYTDPVPVHGDETQLTIRAVALKSGYENSEENRAAYTISYDTVSDPSFDPAPGNYYNGTQFSLSIASPTDGASIYYTTDLTNPSSLSILYTSPIPVYKTDPPLTIKAIAVKQGMRDSNIRSGEYDIIPGKYWHEATNNAGFQGREYHSSVVFDNRMWVIGGQYNGIYYLNDVWYSYNGITWEVATNGAAFSPRFLHTSVVFDNRMWVIGGINHSDKNDVWYSHNGIIWEVATNYAEFYPRFGHTSVVFDNKIWVIAGRRSGGNDSNDVWYSYNGIKWKVAKDYTAFGGRFSHTSVVFDNRMWVIGGYNYGGQAGGEVWYSNDGITWTAVTQAADFTPRYSQTSVIFDNRMWVIGGLCRTYPCPDYGLYDLKDVWWSD